MTDAANTSPAPDVPVKIAAQVVAATPEASVWVSASAGSGKTKVLADRVLRLLLRGVDPGKILCLTFTRAAAAEMQNRIRHLLGEWAVLQEKDLVARIVGLTDETPDAATRMRARRLFAQVLDAPGGLKIQTIHAFCESLLGRFPIEARLSPHFEVMDERTASEALDTARDEVLVIAQAGGEDDLSRALATVAHWSSEEDFSSLLATLAGSRARIRQLLDGPDGITGAAAATRAALYVSMEATVKELIADNSRDEAFDGAALRMAAEALAQGTPTDVAKGKMIANWLLSPETREDTFDVYANAYINKSDGRIAKKLVNKGVAEAAPHVPDILQNEAERVLGVMEKRKAILTAEASEAILTLADALIDRYEDHKKANALLDYDDLILRARALVERDPSWVLFKLDEGIDHILIDEAQDSNPDQWAVVRKIADEFYAGEGARDVVRTVFAVGDEKQSIFSFQGAVPDAFSEVSDHFECQTREAGQKWERVPLDVSFRSAPSVLQAVDRVFGNDDVRQGVSVSTVHHTAHRAGQSGLVEIWPPVMPDAPDDVKPWMPPDPDRNEHTPARRLAHAIATRIQGWLRNGERLESADRPLRAGDIMVLVRRRTDFVDSLIREFKTQDINVAGIDRMVLTSQLAVRDLMALATFALLPEDDLNLAVVLKGPLIGFSEERLFDVCHGRSGSVWRSLRDCASDEAGFSDAVAVLMEILNRADMSAPYEFFAHILGPMRGRARILSRLREEANDPIDEFLALALSYEQTGTPSLQGFLHWLIEGEAEIKRDLDQGVRDEIRVMTVHGAKGLQAPVVFLADTMQTPQAPGGLLWEEDGPAGEALIWPPRQALRDRTARRLIDELRAEQDAEYRRLLYVAMTRAEDRLYVTGYGTRRNPPAGAWHGLIQTALEGFAEPFGFVSHPDQVDIQAGLGWSGEGLRLVNQQRSPPDRKIAAEDTQHTSGPLPGWAGSPAPEEPDPPRPLVPSRSAMPEPATCSPIGDDLGAGFKRGVLVHRLLQSLPELPPDLREERARVFLNRPVHGLADSEISALVHETLSVLTQPDCVNLFGPGSRAEVPVAGVVGGTVISGRIDRLVVDGDYVKILDFKTNRPPPARAEDVPVLYLRQMAAYRALIQKIYEKQEVDCYLVWTEGPRLMQLDAQVLDAHAP